MTIIITLLLIVVVATATFWFGYNKEETEIIHIQNNTEARKEETKSVESDTTIVDSIKSAEEAKNALEERSGTSLNLSNKNLTKVPATIFGQTDLVSLNLSNNKLEGSLQAEVRQLRNLRTLDLSNNNFTGVPAEVGQLSKLEVLDLSFNNLTGLPNEIGNLSNLKSLDLRGNTYSKADLEIIKKSLPTTTEILTD